jgi:S-adenosylmethionine-diacylglycerol 3-amino-3-carboxypropyl transferase
MVLWCHEFCLRLREIRPSFLWYPMEPLPVWVTEAARLPVAFAQVREDALLDRWIVERIGHSAARVLLIASGGCTAAFLATSEKVSHLHLVDVNPAQIALARLKLSLVETESPEARLRLLGHALLSPTERRAALTDVLMTLGLAPDALGPPEVVAELGPDHVGRYERAFATLRFELRPVASELDAVLRLRDPAEQARRVEPHTRLGRALDEAFDRVLALPNLVFLFGEGATRNPVEAFSRHFARRTRRALATLPAADNPYLWQMLSGRFPDRVAYPWLSAPSPSRLPEITWSLGSMTKALADSPGGFDFVHLSNILDWLSPEEATATLDLAAAALRPGGWVIVRQLNSTVDVRGSGRRITWQSETAAELHARDRSFFYRALHVGRKR